MHQSTRSFLARPSFAPRFATLVAAGLVAAASISAGCKPQGGESAGGSGGTIKVGHYASMTGSTATFGTETDNGVKLAMKQINAKGGVLGKQIEVETLDDQSKPEEAKTVATKMAEDANIMAAIGEVASGRSIAAAPVFDRAGIPMISPSSTNEKVTQKGPHIFRVCYIDPFQGYVMAKFAHDNLHLKNVAILEDKKNEYSVGLGDVFNKEFIGMGGTIAGVDFYQEGDADFKAELTEVKAKNPDGLFVPGYYGEVGPIAQQAHQLGLTCPILGGDGWDSPDLVKGAGGPGGALEGAYFSDHYSKDDKAPIVQDFVQAYKKEYGTDPSGNAALGYDAMMLLADAITRAGKVDREAITAAIASTKDFKGVTGTITIDANRNAVKPATVLQIKGDQFVYAATVQPKGVADAAASPAASGSPDAASASPAASGAPASGAPASAAAASPSGK